MGTRPQLLEDLSQTPRVTRVELELNYRSGQAIIDASLQALGEGRTVRSLSEGGEIVIHPPAEGDAAQHDLACELVELAHREGVPYDQITVLSYAGWERSAAESSV